VLQHRAANTDIIYSRHLSVRRVSTTTSSSSSFSSWGSDRDRHYWVDPVVCCFDGSTSGPCHIDRAPGDHYSDSYCFRVTGTTYRSSTPSTARYRDNWVDPNCFTYTSSFWGSNRLCSLTTAFSWEQSRWCPRWVYCCSPHSCGWLVCFSFLRFIVFLVLDAKGGERVCR
jgi:hypothetical protein